MQPMLLRLNREPVPAFRLSRVESLVGRDPVCEVFTQSPSCSRRHALIRVNAQTATSADVTLVDLESRNGSFVNGERVRGSLTLREHDVLEFGGIRFAYLLRSPAELAVEMRLLELATRDALTGLANRATFHRETEREFARAMRYSRTMAVALFDVNRLKRINDDHGHATGDQALRVVGAALRGEIRGYDLAARLSGDEFALLLPESTAAAASMVIERVREQLALTPVDTAQGPMAVTVSAGIVDIAAGAPTARELLAMADRLLYVDKSQHAGRAGGPSPVPASTRS